MKFSCHYFEMQTARNPCTAWVSHVKKCKYKYIQKGNFHEKKYFI